MIEPPTPADEAERLRSLRALNILDSPPEQRFDLLTEAAVRAFDVPVALVSLVDATRQWFKSRQGLEATETPRAISFCGHAIAQPDDGALVVPDATLDPRFADNPLVTAGPRIRFYAGQPLCTLDGARVGTLCLIDRAPRDLAPEAREALRQLACAVEDELNAYRVSLGRHQLEEVIGRGGMGVVYKARDEGLARTVALKVVHRHFAADPEFRRRFREEARGLAAVSHPHVMTIFEIGEDRGVLFMACELLSGGTLAGRVRRDGPLPASEAAEVAAQVAAGLDAIHSAGLVHRDVKPANVLLDRRGTPKLGDFGLVQRVRRFGPHAGRRELPPSCDVFGVDQATVCEPLPALPPASPDEARTTSAGHAVGTPAFMAPEQATGAGADARADLYSLGATLYALLTGRPPFEGSSASVLRALLTRAPEPPGQHARGVPPALDRLVMRLLDKDPAARPASAARVADELRALARRT
ncbi:MAG: protein kinase [Planctomycetes bacterium]|nr:protein kinase [Planctomycetota bacterium]